MNPQPKKPVVVKGYLYIVIETFTLNTEKKAVTCNLSVGDSAKCQTRAHLSGSAVNEVFLVQIAQDTTRLNAQFKQDDTFIGECRYDIVPFYSHPGMAHTMTSDITKADQEKIGTVNVKLTYFSKEFGKIRLRVFQLQMSSLVIQHYKQAKFKAKINIYAQSSPLWDMTKPFDHTLQLLVLTKNSNMQFEVVHTEGILAKFIIYDLQKSGLLIDQTKAYQVSLFNKEKAVGIIKYQVDWIH